MVARFFLALAITVLVFPFLAVWSLHLAKPETPFALDLETWKVGLLPIVFGWMLFLSPILIPGLSNRYFRWFNRITGVTATLESLYSASSRALESLRGAVAETVTRIQSLQRRSDPAPVGPSVPDASDPVPLPSVFTEAGQPPHADPPLPEPSPEGPHRLSGVSSSIKSQLNQLRGRVATLSTDPSAGVESARATIRSLRERVTAYSAATGLAPAELNAYTLETFSHLKQIGRVGARALDLEPHEWKFVDAAFASIPQPLLPGEEDHPKPEPFIYPDEHREDLLVAAAHCRALVSEDDLVRASNGDLERALKVSLAILQVASHRRSKSVERAAADPLLVLPTSKSR
ncbi:MAG: hypothetical protein EA417_07390 [Gammaproteobacteria bacterium]|nr:MAG: hypothetical protein EA417_07390 [Gammaproteobacteria bacterium]